MSEVVMLIGLPGSGKTTFFRQRFVGTHVHVSKDNFRNAARPERRQAELIAEALAGGLSVAVDNTNASVAERAPVIAAARRHGARLVAYVFEAAPRDCVARNARREGKQRVPPVAIFATAKRFVPPTLAEGFEAIYSVVTHDGGEFSVGGEPPAPSPRPAPASGRG